MTIGHRASVVAVALILGTIVGRAQDRDTRAIAAAQAVVVSELVPSLPHVTVAAWLHDLAPTASPAWEVDDCGEQTGDPASDRGQVIPMCADVRIPLASGRVVSFSLLMGTMSQGVGGRPVFFMGTLSETPAPLIFLPDLAAVPTVMSADARRQWAEARVALVRPGMSRTETERTLGRPPANGGLSENDHQHYYVGYDLVIDVPIAADRVTGQAVVTRAAFAID